MTYREIVAWFVAVLFVAADVLLAVELLHRRGSSSVSGAELGSLSAPHPLRSTERKPFTRSTGRNAVPPVRVQTSRLRSARVSIF